MTLLEKIIVSILIPDVAIMVNEEFDIGITSEEPYQLIKDVAELHLFSGENRKAI